MAVVLLLLGGCYYMQAATGQWQVLRKREPLSEVIADSETPPELVKKLELLAEAREFSISVLKLPDNDSYRSYADLDRDYVVWNIFAAPEFSLQPRQSCFPIVGCVSYRGYFSEQKAIDKAAALRRKGFDVAVAGVSAYSTLGNFSDPVLNTMMHWGDVRLVALLFHELAHQVLYIKGDTGFNESFATAVEEFGVRAWLTSRGQSDDFSAYEAARRYRQEVVEIVTESRDTLDMLYESDANVVTKREKKQAILLALSEALASHALDNGRRVSPWYGKDMNNAHLISSVLYEGLLPEFRQLFAACDQGVECFYAAAKEIAALEKDVRDELLSTCDLRNFRGCLDAR